MLKIRKKIPRGLEKKTKSSRGVLYIGAMEENKPIVDEDGKQLLIPFEDEYELYFGEKDQKDSERGFTLEKRVELYGTFKLNVNEYKKYRLFCVQHKHTDINRGAIGGGTEICFMPTGVGVGVSVRCVLCGKEENITDYDSW